MPRFAHFLLLIFFEIYAVHCQSIDHLIDLSPKDISLVNGENTDISLIFRLVYRLFTIEKEQPDWPSVYRGMKMQSLFFRGTIPHETFKFIIKSDHDFVNTTNEVSLTQLKDEVKFGVQPKAVIARTIVEVINCTTINGTACGFNFTTAYTRLSIMKSHFTDVLIVVVGWAYFFAWSISFYPQMILNYQRKSVVGLNFDFLFLNIIGFSAYTIYNSMHYWDTTVQNEYLSAHERSPLPVLLNDVIFALHALAACLITAVQACLYERENQRVHPGFIFYGGALVVLGFLALFLSLISVITYLQFVTSLSYIKMAVTCMKYFPQAVYNYKRKSTVGWSIGNVLLDFTGGLLDVMQMVLQAWNVDDWSAFYGNPVKFGLGMVSMVFDVVFLLQHYAFYRNAEGFATIPAETSIVP